MPTPKIKIAALACSYNRINKTTSFIKSLLPQVMSESYELDIYLLDDNSSDGTAAYITENFPVVNVTSGSGSLFWAGAMRTLWKKVMQTADYDLYLLLNDDVTLFDNAISNLFASYKKSKYLQYIILGTVQDFVVPSITYGGRKLTNKYNNNYELVIPDPDELKECHLGNANVMLIDKATVNKTGIFGDNYIHSVADYAYTLKAIKNGTKVWVAPGFYGHCEYDHGKAWMSAKNSSLKDRINYLYSPKGLEYKQYMHYIREFFPLQYPTEFIKIWVKTLLPIVYDKFKK
jgi:GT2 family glycosyltransferase